VGEGHITILIIEVLNLVFAEATRGTEVEIACVFVPQDTFFFYFGTLPPVGRFVGVFFG
jgi:hypothetical protein